MAQGSGSYYDDYMRSNAILKHCGDKDTKKLLTDRSAYISFLEVQLERVSAACLTTQTFEKRLAELESSQVANDQKVGSLSKVFRLNQEYVEQATQQIQSELAGHASKVDDWMGKFSTELERQQPRMATLEEQFRQCQEYLPRLVETNDAAIDNVKNQTEQEIEEMKTQMFALETRMEEIQLHQGTTERKVEDLTDTVTHKLDKELALVRSSVSEKSYQLERTVAQVSSDLEQFVRQVDASWRKEASETADQYESRTGELQQRLNLLQQELEHGQQEVKEILKKCLDTQHLLSGTVVSLQSELDEVKKEGIASSHEANETMSRAIEDLRERQTTLKSAMQLLQACALEAQQANEDRCSKVADRLAAVEDSFETRTDDLRRRMLAALEDIGDRLHQGAGATTENTLLAARKESESQFASVMEFSATLENRLRILEHTVLSLETKVQRSRAIADVLDQVSSSQISEIRPPEISERLATTFGKPLTQKDQEIDWGSERYYQQRIRDLEDKLHRKAQMEEEHNILFPGRNYCKTSSRSSISSGYGSSFVTREVSKHRDDQVPRRTVKKKTIKKNLKTAQATTSKMLKPPKPQVSRR